MKKEIIKMIQDHPALYDKLLVIKQQAQAEGLTENEYALKGRQLFKDAGYEVSAKDLLDLVVSQSGKVALSDDDLEGVAGGGCNKNCPDA